MLFIVRLWSISYSYIYLRDNESDSSHKPESNRPRRLLLFRGVVYCAGTIPLQVYYLHVTI